MIIIFDTNYKPLADNNELMRKWTKYCNELYNFPIKTSDELIKDITTPQHDISLPPVFHMLSVEFPFFDFYYQMDEIYVRRTVNI